jgi:hypothetical protein
MVCEGIVITSCGSGSRAVSLDEAAKRFTGQGGVTGALGVQSEMIAARTSYSTDFKNNVNREHLGSLERSEHRQNSLDDLRHGVLKILEALEHVR